MDVGVGYQIGLELLEVHFEGTIKMQGGSDEGHSLANEPAEVCVGRMLCPGCSGRYQRWPPCLPCSDNQMLLDGVVGQDGVIR